MSLDEAIIRLDLEALEEGGFVATSPDVPGLVAQGRTLEETLEIARDVARKIAESCLEHGDALPEVFRRDAVPGPLAFAVPVAVP
jgi:predicted RNase H-like HicB family nuclease